MHYDGNFAGDGKCRLNSMTPMLTLNFTDAIAYAASVHAAQVRKGTNIPYLSHLLAVASLVIEHGGTEDQAIGGLLHDVIEDCGAQHEPVIRRRFGDKVAEIVLGCTDAVPAADGSKPPWRARKEAYIQHLESASGSVLLVSCCDKLHNARSILTDYRAIGDLVFDRFTASKADVLWYYRSLAEVFSRKGVLPAAELMQTVDDLKRAA